MNEPEIDLVVPVHDPRRPIERAVGSALADSSTPVRVSVVVHNTASDPIEQRLRPFADDTRLRLLHLHDHVRSPAGPLNAGLDAATAGFTSVMGSDDELEPGALDSWLARAQSDDADVVVARLRHAGGAVVPTPPTRPWRTRGLDGVRDRLSYRSAPLGLVSTARFGGLRFAAGLPVGEDVSYVTRLWFDGARISYDRSGPAYLIHTDVEGRTTVAPRPLADELAYIPLLLHDPWFAGLPTAVRGAVSAKLLRIHVFGVLANRDDPALWTAGERTALRTITAQVLACAEEPESVLSRRDRDVVDAILDPAVPAEELLRAARRRRPYTQPAALLPRSVRDALRREAPLRMVAASALQLR